MRVFLAGASGVIGVRLIGPLVAAGHVVGAMTRSPEKARLLAELGAEPIVCDVFDRDGLVAAVVGFGPDLVLNELTDLPDDVDDLAAARGRNARMRTEGNANLLEAVRRAGSPKVVAQSVAWPLPPGPGADAVAELERTTLEAGGVVLRYGQFHGPGTYYEDGLPDGPRVHVDRAAERTIELLDAPPGVVVVTD
jgi:nucleoside-diphosphate-sugar epimerase